MIRKMGSFVSNQEGKEVWLFLEFHSPGDSCLYPRAQSPIREAGEPEAHNSRQTYAVSAE
jgi:hypothetical protein